MEVLEKLFGGWWGPLTAGALVVVFEYLVIKPLVEKTAGEGQEPSVTVKVKQGKDSESTVDFSRNLIIQQVTRVTPPRSRGNASGQTSQSNGNGDDNVWLLIGGMLILLMFSAYVVARYGAIITNVLVGVACGSFLTALLLMFAYRGPPVPLARWVVATSVAAGIAILGAVLLNRGNYKGVGLAEISDAIRDQGFSDALASMRTFGFEVLAFFGFQMLGAVVLCLLCALVLTRLVGVVVAAAALAGPAPRPLHFQHVKWLYPSGSATAQLLGIAIIGALGLLMVSGAMWSKAQELGEMAAPSVPSTTSAPPATTP